MSANSGINLENLKMRKVLGGAKNQRVYLLRKQRASCFQLEAQSK